MILLKRKKLTVIIIIGIIVIASVLYFSVSPVSGDGYWKTPWGGSVDGDISGIWRESVIVTYNDGSKRNFKTMDSVVPLTVNVGNLIAVEFKYILEAAAIGTGYTHCDLDMSSAYIEGKITLDSEPFVVRWPDGEPYVFPTSDWGFEETTNSNIKRLPVNGVYQEIHTVVVNIGDYHLQYPMTWITGEYHIYFALLGSNPEYHGSLPNVGLSKYAELPQAVNEPFHIDAMNVFIEMQHGINIEYLFTYQGHQFIVGDPGNYLTITPDLITATNVRRDARGRGMYREITPQATFTYEMAVRITSPYTQREAHLGVFALNTGEPKTFWEMDNSDSGISINVQAKSFEGVWFRLHLTNHETENSDLIDIYDAQHPYNNWIYLTIIRSSTRMHLYVYSDEARTTLLGSSSLSMGNTEYEILQFWHFRDNRPSDTWYNPTAIVSGEAKDHRLVNWFGYRGRSPCSCVYYDQTICDQHSECDWWSTPGECRCEAWVQGSGGEITANKYTLEKSGYATAIKYAGFGLNFDTRHAIAAIYDSNGNFLYETEEIQGPLGSSESPYEGTFTLSLKQPYPYLEAGDYILAVQDDSSAGILRDFLDNPIHTGYWKVNENNYGNWLNPLGSSTNTKAFLIWCEML